MSKYAPPAVEVIARQGVLLPGSVTDARRSNHLHYMPEVWLTDYEVRIDGTGWVPVYRSIDAWWVPTEPGWLKLHVAIQTRLEELT